ncbi:hypothetical protein AAB988_27075 [Burkholderia contaminans]|uniref:hypothetical protein n=1 Tax=Burkholderia contaminans TaxID=488447 RepID=UPI00310E4A9C
MTRHEAAHVAREPPRAFESRPARTLFEGRFFRLSDRALFGSAHLPRGLRALLRAAYLYSCRCQDFGGA